MASPACLIVDWFWWDEEDRGITAFMEVSRLFTLQLIYWQEQVLSTCWSGTRALCGCGEGAISASTGNVTLDI